MDPFCVDQLLRWDQLWNLVDIPSTIPVKKTHLLSPSGYQLQMTLWLGMGLCPWFPFSVLGFVWLELVQVLCTLLRCLWAQVWISTVESVRCCFLGVIHNLGLLQSFQRLFCEDGYDSRGRNVTKSSTSHSVHCPVVGLCVSNRILQEASLTRTNNILIYGHSSIISHLLLFLFSIILVVSFLLRLLTCIVSGSWVTLEVSGMGSIYGAGFKFNQIHLLLP